MSEQLTVDTDKVKIKEISKSIAKKLIIKNHYSHAWTKCSVALGVFFKNNVPHKFFECDNDKMIGCIIYGDPVIKSDTNKSISPLIQPDEIYELARLWIADGYGKNIESFVIAESFKWLKKNKPKIKVLVSYADPSVGHLGKIYQATNWICQESFQAGNSYISFSDFPYDWIHPKTVFNIYKTSSPQQLANMLNKPIWAKRVAKKYKYVFVLANKIERKKIINNLKYPPLPYPKTKIETQSEIIKVEYVPKTNRVN